jgi:oxygen-independent coproporphyrinogen-3 oxidase
MLRAYREVSGCNRVSLGVQSLTDELLQAMDRIHGGDEARAAMRAVVEAGYQTWSADLIFGLPGQDLTGWLHDLGEVLEHDSPHLSVYNLMVEEATPLHTMVRRGTVVLPDEGVQLEMLLAARERIEAAGLSRYEISNFARPGHASRHNSLYWMGRPYLGIGAGAHGFVPDDRQGVLGRREANIRKFVPYMDAITQEGTAIASAEDIDAPMHLRERMMMGLRLDAGIDLAEVAGITGIDPAEVMRTSLERLEAEDFLSREGSVLRLTERGLPVSDAVFLRLFEEAA